MKTDDKKQRTANSTYKKLAVQWLIEALCFVSSSVVTDSLVLRNRQLLVAAKRYSAFSKTARPQMDQDERTITQDHFNYLILRTETMISVFASQSGQFYLETTSPYLSGLSHLDNFILTRKFCPLTGTVKNS